MENFLKKIKDKLQDLFEAFLFLLILPFVLIYVVWKSIYVFCLRIGIFLKWRRKGKDIIFVYSDSPHWKEYVEENILPKLGPRCITLKWSKRKWWNIGDQLENRIFYEWGGYNDFNPMAIIFISFFKVRTVRFYKAFKEYKHGKDKLLNERLDELFDILGIDKT